jgi:hypothetical protein
MHLDILMRIAMLLQIVLLCAIIFDNELLKLLRVCFFLRIQNETIYVKKKPSYHAAVARLLRLTWVFVQLAGYHGLMGRRGVTVLFGAIGRHRVQFYDH